MEISLLNALVESISLYLELSSLGIINSEPAAKYYKQGEQILKLVKPVLDAILGSEVASDKVLNKVFEELRHSVEDLRDSFESWQPLLSKVYFVSKTFLLVIIHWKIVFNQLEFGICVP